MASGCASIPGQRWPCDPDFADVSGLAGEMCVRVNDHELLVGEDATTTYELLSCATAGVVKMA